MPGILFVATPSNDVVKDLQDKVISIQDHEVSFLNDTIANMLSAVGIAATVVAGIFTLAFAYVTYSNNRAQKNMKDANEKMLEATEQLEMAQGKIAELDEKIVEAKSIANVAQEKLEELERGQKEIQIATVRLKTIIDCDAILNQHKIELDQIKEYLSGLAASNYAFFNERIGQLLVYCSGVDLDFNHVKMIVANSLLEQTSLGELEDELDDFSHEMVRLRDEFEILKEEMSQASPDDVKV
ncbi:spbB protein [Bacillus cereus group sp. Bce033]|uniref:spbB protein n=1 Tax=Bacillus TaxID=1386 RepID=UPI000F515DCD|nr:spbB protein [Bacillus sp. FDAARGOS_527]AYY25028.1 spbB protein [Bacillus sp. FDAARGOS_527]